MTGPEIRGFSDALHDTYSRDELRTMLLALNQRFDDLITDGAKFPDEVVEIVGVANSRGWIDRLVAQVILERGATLSVKAFLTSYPHWKQTTSPLHPADALRVLGGKSFIGRKAFRSHLKKMNADTGKKVLIITSNGRRCGKTYSCELVRFLSAQQQPSNVVYVDLDDQDYDPGALAGAIARDLGNGVRPVPVQGGQQAARWNHDLVDFLVPQSSDAAAGVSWILLDGFRQKIVAEGTQDLIAQLAQRIQNTIRFRLILLNYMDTLPIAVGAFTLREHVAPLVRSDVEEHMKAVHLSAFGASPSEEQLANYVNGVYAKRDQYASEYPAAAADDQLFLNMAVSEAADIILAG